ncbi:hypothetical protein GCM10028857_23850 [Salinarchaeum chitinilyticum]
MEPEPAANDEGVAGLAAPVQAPPRGHDEQSDRHAAESDQERPDRPRDQRQRAGDRQHAAEDPYRNSSEANDPRTTVPIHTDGTPAVANYVALSNGAQLASIPGVVRAEPPLRRRAR